MLFAATRGFYVNGSNDLVTAIARISMGIALVVLPLLAIAALMFIWPITGAEKTLLPLPFVKTPMELDHRLFFIVIISGSLGSYVHAATSFSTYVGNSSLHKSWTWWYLLRPIIGCVLSLVFYLVIRGGLLSVSGGAAGDLNPFGVAAIAGMVGMFSKQAADKLKETFDNLFRTAKGQGDDQRLDKLTSSAPVIRQISPSALALRTTSLTIQITGENFSTDSKVEVNGASRTTRMKSETELEADLEAADVAAATVLQVLVRNPDDAGGRGASQSLTVA
jgi:hypothetical protein